MRIHRQTSSQSLVSLVDLMKSGWIRFHKHLGKVLINQNIIASPGGRYIMAALQLLDADALATFDNTTRAQSVQSDASDSCQFPPTRRTSALLQHMMLLYCRQLESAQHKTLSTCFGKVCHSMFLCSHVGDENNIVMERS
jgi:hypothetical protein